MLCRGVARVRTCDVKGASVSGSQRRSASSVATMQERGRGAQRPAWRLAVIQLKPSAQATEDEIIQLVKSKLGSVHAPKTVDFLATLPRSPNGKVLKREIRDKFWEGAKRRVG